MQLRPNKLRPARDLARTFEALGDTVDRLWAKLAPTGRPESARRIGFVSCSGGEGTTTIAACAALGLSRHLRARVLLVEANAGRPGLAELMGCSREPGLVEVITGGGELADAVQATRFEGLSVLPAGTGRTEAGLFVSDRAEVVLDELSNGFDFVLLDSPPLLSVPESRSLLWRMDEVCIVLEAGHTKAEHAERAATIIRDSGTRLIGSVLNRHRADLPDWFNFERAA